MPAKRSLVASQKEKRFVCDRPDCTKSFSRSNDLLRHKDTHLERRQRRYGCLLSKEDGTPCDFRANQLVGLQRHINVHLRKRSPCPFCEKDYSDPSSLSVHKKAFHSEERSCGPSAPALPLQIDQPQLEGGSTSHGASPAPWSWINCTSQSTSYQNIQSRHQEAYNARLQPVRGTLQNAASSSSGSARRWSTIASLTRSLGMADSIDKLPPIRGEEWNGESETLPPLSSVLGTGHVPFSNVPRHDIQIGPSDYCRVIPELLF